MQPKVYKPEVEVAINAVEISTQVQQLKEAPLPPKPKLPLEAKTDEEVEAETIDKTDFTGHERIPTTTALPEYDVPPEPKYIFKPSYPKPARKAKIEGTVYLKLLIDSTGKVIKVRIVKSSNPLLDEAAVGAAWKWQFYPAMRGNQPVRAYIGFPVQFSLKGKG
jgi:protein TonB